MDELMDEARKARSNAYVPYSGYAVGAAVESSEGRFWSGSNVEISNYSNTLHAEEIAIAKAIFDGETQFSRIAVSSDSQDGITPCGMCRQTLAEFCDDSLTILCDEGKEYSTYLLADLLPESMGPETILG